MSSIASPLLIVLVLTQGSIALALAAQGHAGWRRRPALLRWMASLGAQGLGFAALALGTTGPTRVIASGLLALGMGLGADALLQLARQTFPRVLLVAIPLTWMVVQALSTNTPPIALLGTAQTIWLLLMVLRPATQASRRARFTLAAGLALGSCAYWRWLHAGVAQPDVPALVLLQASTLVSSLALILIHYERDDQASRLLATLDGLTGAYNRGALIQLGQRELARAMRRERPISLMMVRVDAPSDTALADTATENRIRLHLTELMTSTLQRQDLFGFFGGQEFCAVLPDTVLEGARFVAERLRAQAHDRSLPECGIAYTVSIGLAESAPSELTFEQIVARADAALANAQRAGGHRIEADDNAPQTRADIRENGVPTEQSPR